MKYLLLTFILLFLFSCENERIGSTADSRQAERTKTLLMEAERQVGMPGIRNFQQRKLMKMVYELQDQEDLQTYTYLKSDYTGKLVFVGKSIGYGIPFSAQFTNPTRVVDLEQEGNVRPKYQDNGEVQVVPQADPNGLFMPTSSSATWIVLVNQKTNKPQVVYMEPEIVVSPFPLH